MAKKRKFCAYRSLEPRAYTRRSKYRALNFVRGNPVSRIVRFHMGNPKGNFPVTLRLVSKTDLQIRDQAIEACRQSANRYLDAKIGKSGYHLLLRMTPHHVLRENPLASGAGADRMSTGMKKSFGKSIGTAARIRKGQEIATLRVRKSGVKPAKEAFDRIRSKLPNGYYIVMDEEPKAKASA